ncbi:hypothetical protein FHR85_000353 [Alkalibacillus almallahensis]|nr:hypothetical protein [Alkalibacillus almallahensis]
MRKHVFGVLSITMVIISIVFFLLIRGPNANIELGIGVFTGLSIIGIILAIASKRIWYIIIGSILNGFVLYFVILLIFAYGISEN